MELKENPALLDLGSKYTKGKNNLIRIDMVNLKWHDAEECLRCTTTVNIHYFCIFIKLSLQEFLIPSLRGHTHWNVRKNRFTFEPKKLCKFLSTTRKNIPVSNMNK